MPRKMFLMLTVLMSAMLFSTTASAQQRFVAHLNTIQEVPPTSGVSAGRGVCQIVLNTAQTQITVSCTYSNLTSNLVSGHIHGPASPGTNAGVLFGFTQATGGTSGTFTSGPFTLTAAQLASLRDKQLYVNLHSQQFPGGEIRGQIKQTTTVYDADGDGRTDLTVFRQSQNTFYMQYSINGSFQFAQLGSGTGDNHLPNHASDFDGDGRFDPLLIKLNQTTGVASWTILYSATNTISTIDWGNFSTANVERLVMADYDGDGKEDIAVFRAGTGVWYIRESSTGNQRIVSNFGAPNDVPSVGDYDGDGKADLTVVRTQGANRIWYIQNSSTGQLRTEIWGSATGDGINFFSHIDVDGDGRQDLMVTRAPAGGQRTFLVLRSSDNQPFYLTWGLSSDTALYGDYDGDGRTDFVARRAEGGIFSWYIALSSQNWSNTQYRLVQFGQTGDTLAEEESNDFPVSSN